MNLKRFFRTKAKKMEPPKFRLYEKVSLDILGSQIKEHFWTVRGIIEWEGSWWYVIGGYAHHRYNLMGIETDQKDMMAAAYKEDGLIPYKEAMKRKKEYHCGECYECGKLLKEESCE